MVTTKKLLFLSCVLSTTLSHTAGRPARVEAKEAVMLAAGALAAINPQLHRLPAEPRVIYHRHIPSKVQRPNQPKQPSRTARARQGSRHTKRPAGK